MHDRVGVRSVDELMPAHSARTRSRPQGALAGACAVAVAAVFPCGCGGAQYVRTPGCVDPARTKDVVRLTLPRTGTAQPVSVPQPCPETGESHFAGPIVLTPTEDGLRVQADVADEDFAAGRLSDRTNPRDAAAVFPEGVGPGRPVVELSVSPIPGGYRVDDTVPWESWGLHAPEGTFRFVCALTDRESGGGETEVRVTFFIALERGP